VPDVTAFYLQGRSEADEDEIIDIEEDFDVDELADKMIAGENLRTVTLDAARRAVSPLDGDGTRKELFATRPIKRLCRAAGGDESACWKAWLEGLTEGLAHRLEDAVLDAVEERDDGDLEDDDKDGQDEDAA